MLKWPFPKDPQSNKKYTVEWHKFLSNDEVITASQWIVPDGITSAGNEFEDDKTHIQIAGGVEGEEYIFTNIITTDTGETVARDVMLQVENR